MSDKTAAAIFDLKDGEDLDQKYRRLLELNAPSPFLAAKVSVAH